MKIWKILAIICILMVNLGSSVHSQSNLNYTLSAYADAYFAFDNDNQPKPWEGEEYSYTPRQFSFVDIKKEQFDINIAQVSANVTYTDLARGKITLQYGSLADRAYGGFPVQEASIGFQLFDNFWLDGGIFLTHIGGESYLPKDNWLTSHSIVTYFEPFYQTGVKGTYSNGPLTAAIHILNGNGIINDNNDNKTIGIYILYNFTETFSISYADVIGNEEPGSPNNSKLHMLHNVCLNSKLSDNFELKGQLDFATKEKVKSSENGEPEDGSFLGVSAQGRYTISEKIKTALRLSYIDDGDQVYATGLSGLEASLGLEVIPIAKTYFRFEFGYMQFDEGDNEVGNVFLDSDGKPVNSRMSVLLNMGIWLD
jgi:hypothetical protein